MKYVLTFVTGKDINCNYDVESPKEVWDIVRQELFEEKVLENIEAETWYETHTNKYARLLLEMESGDKVVIPYVVDNEPGALIIDAED